MYDFNEKVYVIIPKKCRENKRKITYQNNNNVLNMTVNVPAKNLTKKKLNKIIQSNNFIKVETNEILEDILKIGNLMNKFFRNINLKKWINCSLKNYVDNIIPSELDNIKNFVDKNDNKTIEEKVNNLATSYEFTIDDELSFYIYLYEVWEIISLRKNAMAGRTRLPYLYSNFIKIGLQEDFKYKLSNFLDKYESLNKFRFHLIENNSSYDNYYDMILATEDMRVAVMFSILKEFTYIDEKQQFDICSVEGCYNLFRKTQKNNIRCNTYECNSERVKSYQ